MRRFLAIDGEAIDERYCLLADDAGDHLVDLAGLGSRAIFEWLLERPRDAVLVCFGLGYDANQWLADLSPAKLRTLNEQQVVRWQGYTIRWLQGRAFSVKHVETKRYARVFEVFGFFQTSFVRALESWGFEPPAELPAMKRRRGTFTRADLERVTAYCVSECRLLVRLMDALKQACVDAGIYPRQWWGAGSLAGALLADNVPRAAHVLDAKLGDERAVDGVLSAYFGGRVELLRQGVFAPVRTLDLRSAYPAAIAELPSLEGARLVERRRYDAAAEHAVWRVEWSAPAGKLMPFPLRRDWSIYYPRAGAGVYHACEVRAAIAAGFDVAVAGGWVLRLRYPDARPFAFVPGAFAERARLKRAGHPAEKALKLALNSVYGKLAQGFGFRGPPPWQSYFWAGEVTARTRARMLELALRSRELPIMVSTDGVFFRERAPAVPRRSGLGSWERGGLDQLFAAQAGVYQGFADGRELLKSRGFLARDVDFDALREGFLREGPEHVHFYNSRRFVGLGSALAQGNLRLWRQWETSRRALQLWPERKVVGSANMLAILERGVAGGEVELDPPPSVPGYESEPYVPKGKLLDERAVDNIALLEQPHIEPAP